jgi:hypothetical protein
MGKNQDPGSGISIPDPQHWLTGQLMAIDQSNRGNNLSLNPGNNLSLKAGECPEL